MTVLSSQGGFYVVSREKRDGTFNTPIEVGRFNVTGLYEIKG